MVNKAAGDPAGAFVTSLIELNTALEPTRTGGVPAAAYRWRWHGFADGMLSGAPLLLLCGGPHPM